MDLKSLLNNVESFNSNDDKMGRLSSRLWSRDVYFRLVKVGIDSINAARFIPKAVRIERDDGKDFLVVDSKKFVLGVQTLVPSQTRVQLNKNVYVAAFGKAALSMSVEIEKILKQHLVEGVAIIPYDEGHTYAKSTTNSEIFPVDDAKTRYFYGAQSNLPDMLAVNATKRVIDMCRRLTSHDLLIALISGGGSALLAQPVDLTGDASEDLRVKLATIQSLVRSGADINELNTVRSCLSQVKGGNLALLARDATIVSLIISDVIDDPLDIIASGPTCPSFFALTSKERVDKALSIIYKYELNNDIPESVMRFFKQQQQQKESLNRIDNRFANQLHNYLIFNNQNATDMICSAAKSIGCDYVRVLTNSIRGEAKVVGFAFACLAYTLLHHQRIKMDDLRKSIDCLISSDLLNESLNMSTNLLEKVDDLSNNAAKICLVSGGETTVNLKNVDLEHSKGGRNQELTLAFELLFGQLMSLTATKKQNPDTEVLFSSFGSDGIDGPTDAAGAYYEYETNVDENNNDSTMSYLTRHDSYSYFESKNRLIKTGPTGTNVSDLQILILKF